MATLLKNKEITSFDKFHRFASSPDELAQVGALLSPEGQQELKKVVDKQKVQKLANDNPEERLKKIEEIEELERINDQVEAFTYTKLDGNLDQLVKPMYLGLL